MAYNLPGGSTSNLTIGPALFSVGPTGATPTAEFYLDNVSFSLDSEDVEVMQGAPQRLIHSLASAESLSVGVNSLEVDLDKVVQATSAGTTNSTTKATWGEGTTTRNTFAIRVQHRIQGSGNTFDVRVFEAVADGSFGTTFDDSQTNFDFGWKALRATSDWASVSIDALAEIHIIS